MLLLCCGKVVILDVFKTGINTVLFLYVLVKEFCVRLRTPSYIYVLKSV